MPPEGYGVRELVLEEQVCKDWGVSPAAVMRWRQNGLAFVSLQRGVRGYFEGDLQAFLYARRKGVKAAAQVAKTKA